MNPSPLLARADLLRALALAGEDKIAARRYAELLKFASNEPVAATFEAVIQPTGVIDAVSAPLSIFVTTEEHVDRLRAPFFAITACRRLDLPEDRADQPRPQPLTVAQCAPRETQTAGPPFVPLVRRTRLWPALKRSLLESRQRGLDLPRVIATLAQALPLRRLPRGSQAIWGGELLIVWDRSRHLWPYQEDFESIVGDLLRQRGAGGCTLWVVDGSPSRIVQRWPEPGGSPDRAAARLANQVPSPPPATRLLILSDAGTLGGESGARRVWVAFMCRLQQQGAQPVLWTPLAPAQIEVEVARSADVFCLQPGGGLRRQRGRIADDEQRRGEQSRLARLREQLLARMACCIRVEPALLRALRGIAPATATEPALEALVWGHQPVVYDSLVSRAIAADHVARYREAFSQLDAGEQLAALERALHIHAWRGRATEAAELLIWQAHARPEAQSRCLERIDEARRWFAALREAATLGSGPDAQLRQYTRDLVARNAGDKTWIAGNSEWLAPLWVATGEKDSPPGLQPEHLLRALDSRADLPLLDCQLGMQAEGLMLWGAERPAGPAQSRIGSPLRVKWLLLTRAGGTRFVDPAEEPQIIAAIDEWITPGATLTITAGRQSYLVRRIERPAWAHEFGRDACGLYADLRIPVEREKAAAGAQAITQRMRYIEAGHFRMGSPESEAERYSDEGPQHEVTLSEGFWLADTACTQALWEALMGDNPSHFNAGNRGGPQHPVDSVSWDDVQLFLRRLEQRVPGCTASLPGEAEWEYACRAGSTTPFSFGENITPEQVNYRGDYSYRSVSKGLYREVTVPVATLPANSWGLYEMHGNLWEWCADGRRRYANRDELDPRGQEGGAVAERVLRGGSWRNDAWIARSAHRRAYSPDHADQHFGFRFCLRCTSRARATERPGPWSGTRAPAGTAGSTARSALAAEPPAAATKRGTKAVRRASAPPKGEKP